MKASQFKKFSLLEQVRVFVKECEIHLQVESIDPAILSDIGDEGVVFDGYVVYMAKGEYEFPALGRTRKSTGYHIWKEVQTPGTRDTPPDGDVVEVLTTQVLSEAIKKVLEMVVDERINAMIDHLADSEAAEAEEEYDKIRELEGKGEVE